MKLAIVTGSLAPYASRLYTAVAKSHDVAITIFQCVEIEPGRKWQLPEEQGFRLVSLPGYRKHRSDVRHIYVNPSVLTELRRLRPDRIIIDSFSPTMIMAALYAMATRTPFALAVEGSREIDPGETSWPHAFARRFIARNATYGNCTSEAARQMMVSWGLPAERTGLIPHAGSWPAPVSVRNFDERPFDLLLCGTLNERKNPMFIADVVERMVSEGSKPSVRIVGDGELRDAFASRLKTAGVEARFDGYLQSDAVIEAYQSAKVVVFPTKADTWGLVANEALLCGAPVLASPHAVSSRDLVLAFGTGLVRPLDVSVWTASLHYILSSPSVWNSFRMRRADAMDWFSLESAVAGFAAANRLKPLPQHPHHAQQRRALDLGISSSVGAA